MFSHCTSSLAQVKLQRNNLLQSYRVERSVVNDAQEGLAIYLVFYLMQFGINNTSEWLLIIHEAKRNAIMPL